MELEGSDFVVGNLECLSAGVDGENTEKRPRLKTETKTLGYLTQINLGLACLANNHVYDNLEDGFRRTTVFLKQNNIDFTGASLGNSEAVSEYEIEIKGIRLAFFNYVSEDTNPGLPSDAGVRLSILNKQKILEDLSRVRDVDHRILILHWGGKYENSYYPGPSQIQMARDFIKGGADLIIGHHSHTLQPGFIYRGKSVFFSLGNFCFADINSDHRVKEIKYRRWKESAIIKVNFNKENYRLSRVPFRLENLRTLKDQSVDRRYRVRRNYFKLILFSRFFWFIYYFGNKYLRPVIWELRRSDPERNLMKRLFGLNRGKIMGMFK